MYYVGTVLLRMDENTFWRTTPRKLFSLMEVHVKINNPDAATPSGKDNKQVARDIAGW
jgi:hypothetical protein